MQKKYSIILFLLLSAAHVNAQPKPLDLVKGESFVTFRLHHPFHDMESTSKDAECRITIDQDSKDIKNVTAQVDVTTFNSGNSNRDSHAMEVIDALTYPDVDFVSTSIIRNGDSVRVAGKLTFHGTTRDIVIPALCTWLANKLMVQGRFDVSLTEFKIERPSLLLIPVDDTLKFSFIAVFGL